MEIRPRRTARTIWISDLHLGLRFSKVDVLLEFLLRHRPDKLYLVGDVFDGWALKKSWFWSDETNDVLQRLLWMVGNGTSVVYIPGNHDEFARAYCGLNFGNVRVANKDVHVTKDGRRILVLHGDEFDGVLRSAPRLYRLGAVAYSLALRLNHWIGLYLRRRGSAYWSLSAYLKSKTKSAIQYINRFEELVVVEARRHRVDGVICGHIHSATIQMIGDVLYANSGDWVESCTAVVEDFNGLLRIERFAESMSPPAVQLPALAGGDGAARDVADLNTQAFAELNSQVVAELNADPGPDLDPEVAAGKALRLNLN